MMRPRSPRLTLAVALAALGGLVLTSCGDDAADVVAGGPPPPAEPTAVLTLDISGGFVPVGADFASVPSLTVLSDGTAITGAPVIAIYPGPLLAPLNSRMLTDEGVEAVLDAVRASGLLDGDADFGQPPVADAPTTSLTVVVDGETTVLAANGLQEATGDPSLTPAQRDARARLRDLVDQLSDLEGLAGADHVGPEQPWTPEALWVIARPVAPDEPADADGLEPRIVAWTVDGVDLAATGEARRLEGAEAAEVLALLAPADTLTRFTQGDVTYEVFARPAIPGDEP